MKILKKLINKVYIIIPAICVIFWAFYFFIKIHSFLSYDKYWDFGIFYEAGQQIFANPRELYNVPNFLYFPSAALFFAIFISIKPIYISYYLFYIFNIITGIFFVYLCDRIFLLMELKYKSHKFIFLLILSNGWFLHGIFYFSQTKLLVGLIIAFIIKREIEYRIDKREKDWRYFLINNGLFIFGIGMAGIILIPHVITIVKYFPITKDPLFITFTRISKDFFLLFILFIVYNVMMIIYLYNNAYSPYLVL